MLNNPWSIFHSTIAITEATGYAAIAVTTVIILLCSLLKNLCCLQAVCFYWNHWSFYLKKRKIQIPTQIRSHFHYWPKGHKLSWFLSVMCLTSSGKVCSQVATLTTKRAILSFIFSCKFDENTLIGKKPCINSPPTKKKPQTILQILLRVSQTTAICDQRSDFFYKKS